MSSDPRALLAGLARRGVLVFRVGERLAAGPSRLLEDVDRAAIRWAKADLLRALSRRDG